MRITKFGHCCMLVEEGGLSILFDPGNFSDEKHPTQNIDVILLTHEHADHVHIPFVQAVLKDSPQAVIYTIASVKPLLETAGIACKLLEHGGSATEKGVLIEAFGTEHAVILPDIPVIPNTGFFVANRFFYPGDAFTDPGKQVEILALPLAGPWMKLSEAIAYARVLKPKHCFGVHDGVMVEPFRTMMVERPAAFLAKDGIAYQAIDGKGAVEF